MSVQLITDKYEFLEAADVIDRILAMNHGSVCITCSFQIEDMVVLDLLRRRLPRVPVLFLDTGYHFAETYAYRDRMTRDWKLNLVNVVPEQSVPDQETELGLLYRSDPTSCCQRRKVEPLMKALQPFDVWFTGLRREQSPTRKNLKIVEVHQLPTGKELVKVSPLAAWDFQRVWAHASEREIERLELYDEGYLSIGCQPCTRIPAIGADPRSGRWNGEKQECGIHTFSRRAL